jgi:hypothetical protein
MIMAEQLFAAAQRTSVIISRTQELEQIKDAIYRSGNELRIVLLTAEGGLGKSRLVEEVLWRAGNRKMRAEFGEIPAHRTEWNWQRDDVVVADLIDLDDIRLHTRGYFMRQVREALRDAELDFTRYDGEDSRQRRLRAQQADYATVQQATKEAEVRFLEDYKSNAQGKRIVLALDTAERLAVQTSQWLWDRGLITTADLTFTTQNWLDERIANAELLNTTLIISGRGGEGKQFFDVIEEAIKRAQASQKPCEVVQIDLKDFDLDETRQYFTILAQDWQARKSESAQAENIARTFQALVKDQQRLEVLWLYTGGQPVRLSLYADLIVEGRTIPARLDDSLEEARRRVATAEGRGQARFEIEDEFITLLFGQPTDLRSQILRALVRAPLGLDAEQLYFIFDASPNTKPKDWKPEKERLAEIEKALQNVRWLSLAKPRARRKDDSPSRLGLQDEIYRIYAEHMAHAEQNRKDEHDARQLLYAKLRDWAAWQQAGWEAKRKEFQADDEQRLHFNSPATALSVRFRNISQEEQNERIAIVENIRDWELEWLHYLLLHNPYAVNDAYFDLAEERWLANDQEGDAITQAVMWRVIFDPYASQFFELPERPVAKSRGETSLQVLRRAVEQESVARWIARFVLRKGERGKDLERAIQFCDAVEQAIEKLENPIEKYSWQHTFTHADRLRWREYARILLSRETKEAVERLEGVAKECLQLLGKDEGTSVFPDRGERGENGFKGHPAGGRLRRLVALMHNWIGYGYTQLGRFGKANEAYSKALWYMRGEGFEAQRATTINNLSRTLSEMGRQRARRLCLDGLALRKEQGAEIPIAYSWNTLALIDNDWMRPDLAWGEVTTALAYFRRTNEPRGLGLALIQLGEALRRLAYQAYKRQVLVTALPEDIFEEAERALQESIELFTNSPAASELARRVEAYIEMGCIQRDRIQIIDPKKYPEQIRRRQRDALYYYNEAVKLAQETKLARLELDAQVNIGWLLYYAGDLSAADGRAQEILTNRRLLPADCFLRENQPPPSAERDDLYVYYQLSKLSHLRGRVAMDNFLQRVKEIEAPYSADAEKRYEVVHKDTPAQEHLKHAAEQYVLASAYSQLFSIRSVALSVIWDTMYDYTKKFNRTELADFHGYVRAAREKYRVDEIKPFNPANADEFLRACFGVGSEEG